MESVQVVVGNTGANEGIMEGEADGTAGLNRVDARGSLPGDDRARGRLCHGE